MTQDDGGGGGCRAKDAVTFLYYDFWGKCHTLWFLKVGFIKRKLSRSSNWYSGCYLFIEISYFMSKTFSLIDICSD